MFDAQVLLSLHPLNEMNMKPTSHDLSGYPTWKGCRVMTDGIYFAIERDGILYTELSKATLSKKKFSDEGTRGKIDENGVKVEKPKKTRMVKDEYGEEWEEEEEEKKEEEPVPRKNQQNEEA